MTDPVRTRFAPSPTGSLHVGGARTALYCRLIAHKHGGKLVLRIEDTDRARSTEEATRGIQRDLKWLGLHWDEGPGHEEVGDHGPYFQSKRLEIYDRHVQQLLDTGRAYEAWETREELDGLRKQVEAHKDTFRYHRRAYTAEELDRFHEEGRSPVVRMAAPGTDYVVRDLILGEVTVPAADLDDIVIRKADGFPTYHFAVVIDDYLMEISLVLRGQEHLMNTAKHLILYEAFGWEPPAFAHLPLIFNPGGSKMSKRDKAKVARAAAHEERERRGRQGLPNAQWSWLAETANLSQEEVVSFMNKEHNRSSVGNAVARVLGVELPMIEVMDFRRRGFLPEALLNYLTLLGWSAGDDREVMTRAEVQEAFTLDRVNTAAARFDLEKLRWMNGEYMRRLPIERLQEVLALYLEVVNSPMETTDAVRRRMLLEMYRQRSPTLSEMDRAARFLFERPQTWDPKAYQKHLLRADGVDRLRQARDRLAKVTPWTAEAIEATLEPFREELGVGMGKVAQPLRVAVSGTSVSPPIYDTLAFLEQDEVLARIDNCLEFLAQVSAR
ncbi:MAG: glutamate--tRNA ligase [Deltaproteobacteria bacterium]|nr:glutamate--tRNA ligase [Deltaproteobacteria bacterium]